MNIIFVDGPADVMFLVGLLSQRNVQTIDYHERTLFKHKAITNQANIFQ